MITLPSSRLNGHQPHLALNELMAEEAQRQLETSGAAAQPVFSQTDVEQVNFRRFNPYSQLTAVALSSALDAYEAGEIMTAARFWTRIAKSDPTIVTVKAKREEAVALRSIAARAKDDSPLAADQAAALNAFYNNAQATHATKRHVIGKQSLLLEQMMESVAFEYAAHHIIFKPDAGAPFTLPSGKTVPGLAATFEYVPLEFFEARTGVLRFLGINNFYNGVPLENFGQWLITTGPGLMFAGCILHYFKRLARHDEVNFSEKFGQPGTLVHTTAQQGTPEGNAALALAQSLASNYRGVIYGAPENKAEYLWPSGGASGSSLVMTVMGSDLKQEMISMWMGADLSTMSRGGGKSANQPVVGASVQGEDQEKKEKRDCRRMSDSLNAQVDPVVLRWFFGPNTPILAEAYIDYPEQEDRAQLRESVTMLVNGGAQVPIVPIAKRLNVPVDDKTGAAVFKPTPVAQIQTPDPEAAAAINAQLNSQRARDPDLENFLGPLAADFRKAFAGDLQPFRKAAEPILNLNDGVAFNVKIAWLKSQLPSLLKEIIGQPNAAAVLDEAMQKSYARGFKSAEQQHEVAS